LFLLRDSRGLSVIEVMMPVCGAFVVVSYLELRINPKHTGCRASFVFCLMLAIYGFGMAFLLYRDLGFYRT
jgi:hypothetical protein